MKTLALSIALGALALAGVPAAQAAPAQHKAAVVAADAATVVQDTDMSSHRRYWRRNYVRAYPRHYRNYGYRPYYRSYGYYPQPYYRSAPVVSFGFGFGGPRYGYRHW